MLLAAASDADRALSDASVGTVFAARPERLSAKRFWVRHAADARGQIVLDDGAVAAVARRRRSLLAAGVVGVRGRFYDGDVVELVDIAGNLRARGVSSYDSDEVARMVGRSTSELPNELQRPVIHADDLVAV